MTVASEALAYNISLGYKLTLPDVDRHVVCRKLFHGKLGGAIAVLHSTPMFFYAEGQSSSEFVEHIFINGDNTYELAAAAENDEDYTAAYLSLSPVVLQAHVTIRNPAILDMKLLTEIAIELGIEQPDIENFIADFEDSVLSLRTQVFDWLTVHGYDGAIIVNDMTPETAGGDWCFRTAYVAFYPPRQVSFAPGL